MSTYCPHCNMLTYDDHRCEYCGKPLNKITTLHEKAKKTNSMPGRNKKRTHRTHQNQSECKTCGHDISTKTIQCPSCGEVYFWKLIILIIYVGGFFAIINLILYFITFKIMGF